MKEAGKLAPKNLAIQYHIILMEMFDEAVVGGTVKQLQDIAAGVKAEVGINLDTFDVFVVPFERYLDRDPTSPEIYEAYGDIFTASPNPYYWKSAIPHYKKAIRLGGNMRRLLEKVAKAEQGRTK